MRILAPAITTSGTISVAGGASGGVPGGVLATIAGTPIGSGSGSGVGGKAAVDPTGVSPPTGRRTAAPTKAVPVSKLRKVPVRPTSPVAVSAPVKTPAKTVEWQGTESPFAEL